MEQAKIDRINFLAKKAKEQELTSDELIEQQQLRQEYIKGFRQSLRGVLDNTYIKDENGNKIKLKKKNLQ